MQLVKKVLVVEDEADYIRTYINFFKNGPYKMLHAKNGRIGLRLVEEQRPDIIIMDWNMPEMTGIEVITRLQEMGVTEDTPIIMATGVMVASENLREALEAGAYDFIRKPLDLLELDARINSALKIIQLHKRNKALMEIEKEYLESKIERQARELSISMTIKHNLANNLKEIEQDLARINQIGTDRIQFLVKEIRKKISGFSDSDRTWEEFKRHFENVNPKFFERLSSAHPNLTNYDRRLCAYVKMGLGNKEIAQISHITADSVKKSITRLRKKLQLDISCHLREYIADV